LQGTFPLHLVELLKMFLENRRN